MITKAWVDDFPIHNLDDPGYGIALSETDLDSGAAPVVITENRPRSHGSRNTTRWYGPRTFSLAGYVAGDDEAETLALTDALKASLLLGDTLHELRFRRQGADSDEVLEVIAVGPFESPAKGYRQIVRWAIALEAPDPRVYSAAWETLVLNPAGIALGRGLDFALDFPADFRGAGVTGAEGVLVGSPIPTPPTLTFTGPGTLDAFSNDTTGEQIQLVSSPAWTGSDLVVADCRLRTLTVNGFARPELIDAPGTNWWDLQPGANLVRALGGSFVAGASSLTVAYRNARS